MRARARVCVCVYIYIYIYTYLHTHTYMHRHTYMHTHTLSAHAWVHALCDQRAPDGSARCTYIHTYIHACDDDTTGMFGWLSAAQRCRTFGVLVT
jgi:hypothetical protein